MATVRVQLRRGTEQQWYDANPVLAAGEVGIETDTNTFKFGDGATAWRVLDYALSDTVDDYIPLSTKGVANGVASLDASGFIPTAQLPPLAKVTVSAVANTAARLALTAEAGDIAIEADSGQSYVLSASPASTDANWKALVGSEAVVDLANAALVASTGLSKTYDDSAGTITFSASSAISTAAADATAKATAAIDTAASDATAKANAAQAAAIANTTTQINNLIDSAPGTLNTLGEIATALAADESAATALTTLVNTKAPLASPTFTGVVTIPSGASISGFAPLASPTFTGTVTTGHILPATDVSSDLGSPAKMWRDVYVGPGSLYVNGQKVLQTDAGDVVITADANENLALRTSGSGNIELDPTGAGTVSIKGPMVIEASANITSADGNGINFGSTINTDAISSKTLNTDLSLSGNGTGKVYLNDNAEVNGNLVIGGNLTVSGTTTTVNSETISLADNIIDLNSNFTTGSPTENAGIKVKRGDSSDVQIRWNESTDKWEFTNDGTNYSVIAPTDSPTFTGTNSVAALTSSGLITASASGVAFTDGTQTKAGIPSLTTIGTTISAAYNLSTGGLTLRDQLIPISGTYVVTVPTNATTAFPVGTSIDFYQSAGTVASFAGAGGVTIQATPGLKLRTTYSSATLTKVATDTWLLAGDLTA